MRHLLLCLVLVISAGCSVNDSIKPIPVEQQRTYAANFNKVWEAVVTALTELNFSIEAIDKESGLINTAEVVTSNDKALTMTSAHLYGIRNLSYSEKEFVSVKALISAVGKNQTKVRLLINIREKIYNSYNSETAQSNGHLEQLLYSQIQKNLEQ